VRVTAALRYWSGEPLPAFALFGLRQGYRPVLVQPLGKTRFPDATILDLSVSKPLVVHRARELALVATVYNALNDTTVDGVVSGEIASLTMRDHFVEPRRVVAGFRIGF
jgi:hypothetical protein